jgi:type III pantothenate kinase
VLGDSTISAIQSGFFYGWVGLIREILLQIRKSEQQRNYRVIATGGLASMIHSEAPELFHMVEPQLTLKGLMVIYRYSQNDTPGV